MSDQSLVLVLPCIGREAVSASHRYIKRTYVTDLVALPMPLLLVRLMGALKHGIAAREGIKRQNLDVLHG
jgi:hypothetical protein